MTEEARFRLSEIVDDIEASLHVEDAGEGGGGISVLSSFAVLLRDLEGGKGFFTSICAFGAEVVLGDLIQSCFEQIKQASGIVVCNRIGNLRFMLL